MPDYYSIWPLKPVEPKKNLPGNIWYAKLSRKQTHHVLIKEQKNKQNKNRYEIKKSRGALLSHDTGANQIVFEKPVIS